MDITEAKESLLLSKEYEHKGYPKDWVPLPLEQTLLAIIDEIEQLRECCFVCSKI